MKNLELCAFVKVPNGSLNRQLDKTDNGKRRFFAGFVSEKETVPPEYQTEPATMFQVLTQTRAFSQYGSSMGRSGFGRPKEGERVFDRVVPLNSEGYDQGGAYWGNGARLRVRYTKSGSFAQFYREEFEYNVYGLYEGVPECVTTEKNYRDCINRLRECRENEPGTRFYYEKEKVIPEVPWWHSI